MQTVQTPPKRTDSIVETVPDEELNAFHPTSCLFFIAVLVLIIVAIYYSCYYYRVCFN